MKMHVLWWAIGLAAAGAACAHASGAGRGEREVRQVIDRFYEAAQRRDWDTAGALMASDFELFTDGAESFAKEPYVALLKADDLIVESMLLRDVRIDVAGDGTLAWATFRGEFSMSSHGKRHDVQTAETLILSRTAGRWEIVRAHASVKPLAADPGAP